MSAMSTDSAKLADPMTTESEPPPAGALADDDPDEAALLLGAALPPEAAALLAEVAADDELPAAAPVELLPQAVRASAPAANAAITAVARVRFMSAPCAGP